jgi:uncharacterized Zn finger protein (UPF0148 family)
MNHSNTKLKMKIKKCPSCNQELELVLSSGEMICPNCDDCRLVRSEKEIIQENEAKKRQEANDKIRLQKEQEEQNRLEIFRKQDRVNRLEREQSYQRKVAYHNSYYGNSIKKESELQTNHSSLTVYHITHMSNLTSIFKNGIHSRQYQEEQNLISEKIIDDKINTSRKNKLIGGKSLWNWVNTFFNARNSMLFRLLKENSVDDIVILRLEVDKNENNCVISDENAATSNANFYSGKFISKDTLTRIRQNATFSFMPECNFEKIIPVEKIKQIMIGKRSLVKYIQPILSPNRYTPEYNLSIGKPTFEYNPNYFFSSNEERVRDSFR